MASWCADNLYDVKQWKDSGLELTCSSNQAAKMFDAVLRQLVSWIDCEQLGGIIKTTETMMESEPDFIMGKCLVLGMDAMGTGRSVYRDKSYRQQLQNLLEMAKNCTPREEKHVKAVNYFAHGEMRSACVEWEKILAEHPTDLMAIKFSHDAYFFMGDSLGKRDSVERVISKWKPEIPMYSYLHGMYAFGLEECGDYLNAMKHGHAALEINRQDCWATHAVAHCYEMKGEHDQGIEFMESSNEDWSPCWMLACHNYWHTALFHIEKGDYKAALTIFDSQICERSKSSKMMLDMVDATSLLLRLEMEGVDVGLDRWNELLEVISPHIDDHILAFNDAHISMALSRVGTEEMRNMHGRSVSDFVKEGAGHDNWRIMRDLGELLCDAIVDFNEGRCDAAFEKLYPIRTQIFQIGGSHAQRDVFTQVLIHAGLRSSNVANKKLAVAAVEERKKLKEKSALADRLLAKHTVGHK
uniref:Tetratricopeptide repeat protein 38 n=1 Tax=Ditylenchus dipsaci TaxID=166011 RepID=A0A915EWJ8_9BILA